MHWRTRISSAAMSAARSKWSLRISCASTRASTTRPARNRESALWSVVTGCPSGVLRVVLLLPGHGPTADGAARLGMHEAPLGEGGGCSCARGRSGDDFVHHVALDVGEAEVAAGVAVGEALVVEAHELEDGGVEVVD